MFGLALVLALSSNSSIIVKVDQPFQIWLNVTAGTGYSWRPQTPMPSGLTLLRVFNEPRAKSIPGGPSQEVLVFRANVAGKTHLRLEYVRPWERNVKPAKLQTYTITVHE
jgi:predicted secreted protein